MIKSGKRPGSKIEPNNIIDFLSNQHEAVSIRRILIGLKVKDRETLKNVVRKLEKSGKISRTRGKKYFVSGSLPRVTVIEMIGTDEFGDAIAKPINWNEKNLPPKIFLAANKRGKSIQTAMGRGERCLARLDKNKDNSYRASIIKKIGITPKTIIGIYEENHGEGIIKPADRKYRSNFYVAHADSKNAKTGNLVVADVITGRKRHRSLAKVIEVLNIKKTSLKNTEKQPYTMLSIYEHDIPFKFNDASIAEAAKAKLLKLDDRDDLRNIPLVTIDDENARDFDDAVFAEPDIDHGNSGGWHLIIAIADVAWFVRPNSELDKTAFERGNSVYFPDQVIPMLPEELSNNLCSLKAGEERPCLAVHIWISANGRLLRHKFTRSIIKSHARLNYTQVQNAANGILDDLTTPLFKPVIKSLYGAYQALNRERSEREPLDLDLPEKKIILDANGRVQKVQTRLRHDSHKLIEEFMIIANVAAALTLEEAKQPFVYRIHDEPPAKNLECYRDFLRGTGLKLAKGQVLIPRNFNQILRQAKDNDLYEAISQMTLRSQSQATYSGHNIGHFGLALRKYCHFTSPIRRYADLIVHRALISGLKLGAGAFNKDPINMEEIGAHLSVTERRAATAERESVNRFSSAYLSNKIGEEFSGRISGVTKFGIFVTLDAIAVDGLVPIRSLTDDYYHFDEKRMALRGSQNGKRFCLGMKTQVILKESNPVSGSVVLEISALTDPKFKSKTSKTSYKTRTSLGKR